MNGCKRMMVMGCALLGVLSATQITYAESFEQGQQNVRYEDKVRFRQILEYGQEPIYKDVLDLLDKRMIPNSVQNKRTTDHLTRGEMCEFMMNYYIGYRSEIPVIDAKKPVFSDIGRLNWEQKRSVELAYKMGLVEATEANRFSPEEELTWGEFNEVLAKVLEKAGQTDKIKSIPVTDDYFGSVTVAQACKVIRGLMNDSESQLLSKDSDQDGISDQMELLKGFNPNNKDTDGDGLPDGWEYDFGITGVTKADTDKNGTRDGDEDSDGDGLSNQTEIPLNGNPDNRDTDSDGLSDDLEASFHTQLNNQDTDNDGVLDRDETYNFKFESKSGYGLTLVTVEGKSKGEDCSGIMINLDGDGSSPGRILNQAIRFNSIDVNFAGKIGKCLMTIEMPKICGDYSGLKVYQVPQQGSLIYRLVPGQKTVGNKIIVEISDSMNLVIASSDINNRPSPTGHSKNLKNETTGDVSMSFGKSRYRKVAAGEEHTVLLRKDGKVEATGANYFEQIGVYGWKNISSIAVNSILTVGLKADGTIVVTGFEGEFNNWKNIVAIAAGGRNTYGIRRDGTVLAAGLNNFGQCDVKSWHSIQSVAAGRGFVIGLKKDGTVVALGFNDQNQGDVSGWNGMKAVAAGSAHTVGLRSDYTVVAVGSNEFKQCDVSGWKNIVAVAAGWEHTVGLKKDGTAIAVGSNEYGQCNVSGWKDLVGIYASGTQTVGLKKDGTIVTTGKLQSSWGGQ